VSSNSFRRLKSIPIPALVSILTSVISEAVAASSPPQADVNNAYHVLPLSYVSPLSISYAGRLTLIIS
jgi:hypothetical protein